MQDILKKLTETELERQLELLPPGDFRELGDAVRGNNWRTNTASSQDIDVELWSFFRKLDWHVRVWPGQMLADIARNPDQDTRFEIPKITTRTRNGVRTHRFEINNAVFNLVTYPAKSVVHLYHHGNNFNGYIEFVWGKAPEEVK